MLTINWKQIYEFNLNDNKQWILILYDISQNHYVGVPIYNEEKENTIYLKSINKYVALDEITDYNRSNIKRCIYIKGKPVKITNKEFDDIYLALSQLAAKQKKISKSQSPIGYKAIQDRRNNEESAEKE